MLNKRKVARTKNTNQEVMLIETQADLDLVRGSKGCFGKRAQIGYYALYLGANDGGFIIYAPEDVVVED